MPAMGKLTHLVGDLQCTSEFDGRVLRFRQLVFSFICPRSLLQNTDLTHLRVCFCFYSSVPPQESAFATTEDSVVAHLNVGPLVSRCFRRERDIILS